MLFLLLKIFAFHTVHGVLKTRIMKWFAIPFSSWKDWCWSWSSNTLATWCKELTHWKRPWGWERLKAGEEGDDRGWDGWMASLTWQTWVWVSSRSWWWTGKPGVLQFMGSQSQTWLSNWTELNYLKYFLLWPSLLFLHFQISTHSSGLSLNVISSLKPSLILQAWISFPGQALPCNSLILSFIKFLVSLYYEFTDCVTLPL